MSCSKVPSDELFFVGDNRSRSIDSRFETFPRKLENDTYYKLSLYYLFG
ncbi:S26 family signal peptidase [Kiloniella laminariae]